MVVRSVALCGSQCLPVTEKAEHQLSVMEMKMLRWSAGTRRIYRIRNGDISQGFDIVPFQIKMRESRLRCFGHVLGASDLKRTIQVEGKICRKHHLWSQTHK